MLYTILSTLALTSPPNVKLNIAVVDDENTPICAGVLLSPSVVLTAAHCVPYVTAVQCAGEYVAAAVSSVVFEEDLATLDLFQPCNSPVVRLAKSDPPVGTEVYALGYPEHHPRMSRGIVSGYETVVMSDPSKLKNVFLVTDAAGMGGSSGGGLFDGSGRLIGIASIKGGAFMYFSPVSRILAFLEE